MRATQCPEQEIKSTKESPLKNSTILEPDISPLTLSSVLTE
jgi:hypothetical protein